MLCRLAPTSWWRQSEWRTSMLEDRVAVLEAKMRRLMALPVLMEAIGHVDAEAKAKEAADVRELDKRLAAEKAEALADPDAYREKEAARRAEGVAAMEAQKPAEDVRDD